MNLGTTMASKRRRHTSAVPSALQAEPTPQRMAKAGTDYELGNNVQGVRVLTMRDSPLERSKKRGAITEAQYNAGAKYRHHRYHARLSGSFGGFDLDRVFGGFNPLGGPEKDTHHRQEYYKARDALKPVQAAVVEAVLIEELPLGKIGADLQWKSEPKAIQAVEAILRESLQELVRLWGL